ncbi:CHAT domain-containing tetratricopeptide repeat protein [Polyangium sp. 15x6]|uniref:CHAT domain-containing protein n=1 Tax=Polyangium sp. 15x6 TaxID=3042687 RepID=UPI00249BBCBB|nr:CHAT domain-containing tetratricopeptide repeat protein [Polyangium sp. 15x6]MDI3289267.1 CHAT domain-containing tetratricopeptide repeat protein [Polyangium sp. 15x6]
MTPAPARASSLVPALLFALALVTRGDTRLEATPSPPPPPLPLEVEVAGCGAVLAEPACELPEDRTLRVWVKAPPGARIEAALDARAAPLEGAAIQGGTLGRIEVPAPTRELSVTATLGDRRAAFRLPLRPPSPDPALKEAETLRQTGKLDEAAKQLSAMTSDPDPARRARALGKLARIDRAQGRIEAAIGRFEESMRAHRALGRISDEFLDGFALYYTLTYHGRRLAEARRVLERLEPLADRHPEGRVLLSYYAGLLSSETGDLRTTLRLLGASAEGAERLGLALHRLDVLQLEADMLQILGRGAEGEALLAEVRASFPEDASPCRKASMHTSVGWFALQAIARGDRSELRIEDAIAAFSRALSLHRGACPDGEKLANALTNLALGELFGGDAARAAEYLALARRERPDPDARLAVWLLDIEGRITLGRGAPARALRIYERMAEIAAAGVLPASRFRAALGRAEAFEALGRVAAAKEAYAEAEALLDDHSLLVPLGQGRETFLGRFDEGARRRVDFLLRHDPAEAARAARRSRARSLAALRWQGRIAALGPEERARWEGAILDYRRERDALDHEARGDWKLAADALARARAARSAREAKLVAALDQALAVLGRAEVDGGAALPPVQPGELLLVYHPIRAGWAGFALTREGVTARRLPAPSATPTPEELSRVLLEPFGDVITAARRIRLAPYGELDRIDFQALPFRGAPLLARAPVAYAVDLPGRGESAEAPAAEGSAWAVVVADPRRDLPAARREAEIVAGALEERGGFRVRRLWTREATLGAVREGLETPGAMLFHYAGHGFFGGRDGWESGLPLAEGGFLSVRDVLSLPRVPAHVVLSGCDTARTATEARAEGLGLAQAFVVAGARSVIAATRPIDDRMAQRMMAALYGSPSARGPIDAAAALRDAALAVRGEDAASDWASLRVLVP